jgi:hypothetical protein
MRASLSRSVIGPAGQPCGGSKQIAESALPAACRFAAAKWYRTCGSGTLLSVVVLLVSALPYSRFAGDGSCWMVPQRIDCLRPLARQPCPWRCYFIGLHPQSSYPVSGSRSSLESFRIARRVSLAMWFLVSSSLQENTAVRMPS